MDGGVESVSAHCLRDRFRERIGLLSGKSVEGRAPGRMVPLPAKVKDPYEERYWGILLLRFAAPVTPGELRFNANAERIAREAMIGLRPDGTGLHLQSFALSHISHRLISARYEFGYACDCGHETTIVRNDNIDVATGELLDIAALFPAQGLLSLAVDCVGQILRDRQQMEPREAGALFRDEEFERMSYGISRDLTDQVNWTIGDQTVEVTFGVDSVADYLEGPQSCRFPLDEVKALARPDALFP